ncbi:MAG TPA: DUF6349 family protein [Terrimesophilobacter sp.]|nr:DUF6349 family protein [Terrimesophilobacter sp.]HRP99126.1 DUF6349 family protein [Terrimesophilobacter sp.]
MSADAAGQLAFDIDTLIHDADLQAQPPWAGPAPLHFASDYYTPTELDDAFRRWQFEHGTSASIARSHMWHSIVTMDRANTNTPGHDLAVLSADLRCEHHGQDCHCVGAYLYRAICEPCHWHRDGDEHCVVEAWHDHAWPGWRSLPVVPAEIAHWDQQGRPSKCLTAWIDEHQPTDWHRPGAPIITGRHPHGTRHVPGRSPWGGFDLSHTALLSGPTDAASLPTS